MDSPGFVDEVEDLLDAGNRALPSCPAEIGILYSCFKCTVESKRMEAAINAAVELCRQYCLQDHEPGLLL
jgi:hypothetical protein